MPILRIHVKGLGFGVRKSNTSPPVTYQTTPVPCLFFDGDSMPSMTEMATHAHRSLSLEWTSLAFTRVCGPQLVVLTILLLYGSCYDIPVHRLVNHVCPSSSLLRRTLRCLQIHARYTVTVGGARVLEKVILVTSVRGVSNRGRACSNRRGSFVAVLRYGRLNLNPTSSFPSA